MLGSISATDGHACMLRAMCEVCKLLSSHTGAILRKKSSLIVWQFHVKLEQFWPKILTNCLSRWRLFAGKRSSFPLWRSAGGRSEPSSLREPRSRWGGDRGGGWQLSGLYGRSGGGHGEAHLKYNDCNALHAYHWIMSYRIFEIYRAKVHMTSDHCMYLQNSGLWRLLIVRALVSNFLFRLLIKWDQFPLSSQPNKRSVL